MIYAEVVTFGISISALGLSILNYRKSLKMHNENVIYSKKLDVYMGLMGCLSEYLDVLEDFIHDLKSSKGEISIGVMAERLHQQRKNCQSYLSKNGLLLDRIVTGDFMELIKNNGYDYSTIGNGDNDVMDVIISQAYQKADEIMIKMAKELAIQDLNHSLKFRLRVKQV